MHFFFFPAGDANVWADMLSRWGATGAGSVETKTGVSEEQTFERAAQATLRVRRDRILPSEAHAAARTAEAENGLRGDEERWPSLQEIREAQEAVSADVVSRHHLVSQDGLLTDAAGHIFVPANPAHLRARLLVIAHAGAAGHRGQRVTERDLKARFIWSELAQQVSEFVRQCLLCCKTRGGGGCPAPYWKGVARCCAG